GTDPKNPNNFPATVIKPIPTINPEQILPEIVYKGDKSDLTDNVINLPEGTKVEEIVSIDTNKVGNQTGKVKVTFPDGSSVIVEIPAVVKDKVAWTTLTPANNNPNTGDNNKNIILMVLLVSSITAFVVISNKKKEIE
ncbi:MAG: Rib/alpha-like domain-containing protein, partial [Helcococcus sp.]|nr:Rib/alpha-like domain-containing protein [Helcococcus sp.]